MRACVSDDGVNDERLSREKMQIVTVCERINVNPSVHPQPRSRGVIDTMVWLIKDEFNQES